MIVSRISESDIPRICEIENRSFTHPWSEASIRSSFDNPSDVFFAAREGDKIMGYCLLSDYGEDGYITNIAVSPEFRRMGVGRELMRFLIDYVSGRYSFISLEVRASNSPAIALYRQFGFEDAGIRKAYYSSPVEDALIMTRFFTK